ncbi:MAG: hypothetical protein ACK5G7_03900 [Erysipelotrichaceae bacterium]
MFRLISINIKLRVSYTINVFLFGLKKIPLLGKYLPTKLYSIKNFKVFGYVINVLWEIISVFLGKFLYFLTFVFIPMSLLELSGSATDISLTILFFLLLIGAMSRNNMFSADNPKYYAISLMRMSAKSSALFTYFYNFVKDIVGVVLFIVIFGFYTSITVPLAYVFAGIGAKLLVSNIKIILHQRKVINLANPTTFPFLLTIYLVLFLSAYLLVFLNYTIPVVIVYLIWAIFILFGLLSIYPIIKFDKYHFIYHRILSNYIQQQIAVYNLDQLYADRMIDITDKTKSKKFGFQKLHDLFVKRHRKILWRSTKITSAICLIAVAFISCAALIIPKEVVGALPTFFAYIGLIMGICNKSERYIQALFMNCDNSLLTFSLFRNKDNLRKLFLIRLKTILMINTPVAIIIGSGFVLISIIANIMLNNFWFSEVYLIYFITPILFSIVLSNFHLTIYYLLQPFYVDTEKTSVSNILIVASIYPLLYLLIGLITPSFIFLIILTCLILVILVICYLLIYYFAHKTFRIKY